MQTPALFFQLLRFVAEGEESLAAEWHSAGGTDRPDPARFGLRPKVGEVTSAPVRWSAESFAALDEEGIKELGLL